VSGTQGTSASPGRWSPLDDEADRLVGETFEDARLAKSYPALYEERSAHGEHFRARLQLVLELLATCEGGRLLDAGCGTGLSSRFLLDHRPGDFSITALDRSQAMMEEARSVIGTDSGVEFVVERLELMPFEDATFDVAVVLGALEYLDIPAAVGELARVVRPGGVLITSMQNRYGPYHLWESAFRRVTSPRDSRDPAAEHPEDERPFRRILRRAGFSPTEAVYYNFNLFLSPFDYWYPELSMRAAKRLAPLGRGPLRRLAADYLIQARRS